MTTANFLLICALNNPGVKNDPAVVLEVNGPGFLRFASQGRLVYAKQAILNVKNGQLVSGTMQVLPHIEVPAKADKFTVDATGTVWAIQGSKKWESGRIALAYFYEDSKPVKKGEVYICDQAANLCWPGEEAGQLMAMPIGRPDQEQAEKPTSENISSPVDTGFALAYNETQTKLGGVRYSKIAYKPINDLSLISIMPGTLQSPTPVNNTKVEPLNQPKEVVIAQPALVKVSAPIKTQPEPVTPTLPVTVPTTKKAPVPTKTQPAKEIKGTINIDLDTNVEVEGSEVLLGEIASIAGDESAYEKLAAISLGESPAAGFYRAITQPIVLAALRKAGYDIKKFRVHVTPGVKVTRKAQQIQGAELISKAAAAAIDKYGLAGTLTCDEKIQPILVPFGEVQITADRFVKNGTTILVTMKITAGGKQAGGKTLTLHVSKDAIGVTSGQAVRVILKTAGAAVETKGRALQTALIGEIVSVTTDTGSTHKGVVIAPNVVEVTL